MARWEPGAAERLQEAALELFEVKGFEETTAGEIARSVGLTERTFFRWFADKREVLFLGQDRFAGAFLDGLPAVVDAAAPMPAVASAVRGGGAWFPEERRPWARRRQAVLDAHAALQERERHKLAGLATALARTLADRGVDPLAARLAADAGVSAFGAAFAAWVATGETRPFATILDEALATLPRVVGGR